MTILKAITVLSSLNKSWENSTDKLLNWVSRLVEKIKSVDVQEQSILVKNDTLVRYCLQRKLHNA